MGCGAVQCRSRAEQDGESGPSIIRLPRDREFATPTLGLYFRAHFQLARSLSLRSSLPPSADPLPPVPFLPSASTSTSARTRSVPSSLSPSLFLHSLDGWSIGHMRGRGALRARETASRRDMYRLTTTLPGALAWSGLAWPGLECPSLPHQSRITLYINKCLVESVSSHSFFSVRYSAAMS